MAPPTTPPSKPPTAPSTPRAQFSKTLLARSHPPATAARIHADKVAHKPLILHADPSATDARAARRAARAHKSALQQQQRKKKKSTKPRPLSARDKRRLCLFEIPKAERRWALYEGLHALWLAYVRGLLGLAAPDEHAGDAKVVPAHVTPAGAGAKLAAADMHGAEVEVVRSGCVGRVGARGIVVRDTKFTFVLVTRADTVVVVPKEGSWFRLEIERAGGKALVFELQGDMMRSRAPERVRKRFKMHLPEGL